VDEGIFVFDGEPDMFDILFNAIQDANPSAWKETLPRWIVLNCIGFAVFIAVSYLGFMSGMLTFGAALFLGLMQWIAMDKLLGIDWYWSLASVPAYVALLATYLENDPLALGDIIYILPNMPLSIAAGQPNLGLMLLKVTFWLAVWGLLQWLVLRQFLHRALVWPIASAVAGFFGTLVALLVTLITSPTVELSPILFWPFFALIYIPATGITLIVLKTLPKPTKEDIWY
jgi:hypothetical protein